MTTEQIANLSDEELTAKLKSAKSQRILHAFLLGFSFAIMLVGLFAKGLGVGFFLPLAVFLLFINSGRKSNGLYKILTEEFDKRNLKLDKEA